MKVAIPTMQSGMNGRVGSLEDCPYLVVSGLGMNDVDLVENPMIVIEPQDFARETSEPWLIEEGVQVLLVAQCDREAAVPGPSGNSSDRGCTGHGPGCIKMVQRVLYVPDDSDFVECPENLEIT